MDDRLTGIVKRRLLDVVAGSMTVDPVIGLQGPRSVGKSTLLRLVASKAGVDIVDLDDPATRAAVSRDPGAFVQGPAPVCIDEYQHVPLVLDAIKAELNRDQRPGRFVITGSTRHDALPAAAQSLTGRLHLLTIRPLSQGEIAEVEEDFIERCMADPQDMVDSAISSTTRKEYIDRAVAGGFPMALQRPPGTARRQWFDDYIDQTLERDLRELSRIGQRAKLSLLLDCLAGQTAQLLNVRSAAHAVGLEPRTAENYTQLLESVFLIARIPAWGTTLRARTNKSTKVHVFDSGIAARRLRLSTARLASLQPAALTEFGHLLETFVVGEILKHVSWSQDVTAYGHWRTHDGDEVDLVLERDDGSVVAFEVKAAGRVAGGELGGLRKLRNALGDRFLAGIALYTGTRSYGYEDKIYVVPIDRLWTAGAGTRR
ncbi:MAG: ATP-binding protein [Acidimicrobiales bacterium]